MGNNDALDQGRLGINLATAFSVSENVSPVSSASSSPRSIESSADSNEDIIAKIYRVASEMRGKEVLEQLELSMQGRNVTDSELRKRFKTARENVNNRCVDGITKEQRMEIIHEELSKIRVGLSPNDNAKLTEMIKERAAKVEHAKEERRQQELQMQLEQEKVQQRLVAQREEARLRRVALVSESLEGLYSGKIKPEDILARRLVTVAER